MSRLRSTVVIALTASTLASNATAQEADAPGSSRVPIHDPTGGAYTSPAALFVPAAALPALNARVTVGSAIQPAGSFDTMRPQLGAELGLGGGFTAAVGSQWFGGDVARTVNGMTPYVQLRYQLFGAADGMGWQGGTALTGKRVGWHGGDGEVEASFSLQYRTPTWETGIQGTLGQSLVTASEHDVEGRGYLARRVLPSLAVGVAAQVRADVGRESPEAEAQFKARGLAEVDVVSGAIASYTFERFQVGALAGVSTLGLYDRAGFIAQGSGSVRF